MFKTTLWNWRRSATATLLGMTFFAPSLHAQQNIFEQLFAEEDQASGAQRTVAVSHREPVAWSPTGSEKQATIALAADKSKKAEAKAEPEESATVPREDYETLLERVGDLESSWEEYQEGLAEAAAEKKKT